MDSLISLLTSLGLTPQQAQCFVVIYTYGPLPASTIASRLGIERTNCYKIIQWLVAHGYVAQTLKEWTRLFFVSDEDIFAHKLQSKQQEIEKQHSLIPLLHTELQQQKHAISKGRPIMQFFEGKKWLIQLFDDVVDEMDKQQIIVAKAFGSNTREHQATGQKTVRDYAIPLINRNSDGHIHIQTHLGNGIMTLENIFVSDTTDDFLDLPADHGSVVILIVGNVLYQCIFHETPFAIKTQSDELSQAMHFLLRQKSMGK